MLGKFTQLAQVGEKVNKWPNQTDPPNEQTEKNEIGKQVAIMAYKQVWTESSYHASVIISLFCSLNYLEHYLISMFIPLAKTVHFVAGAKFWIFRKQQKKSECIFPVVFMVDFQWG